MGRKRPIYGKKKHKNSVANFNSNIVKEEIIEPECVTVPIEVIYTDEPKEIIDDITPENRHFPMQGPKMSKNSHCFVSQCKSGYPSNPEKNSLFRAPKDPNRLQKWITAIPRKDRILTTKDVVCEKHFLDSEVTKQLIIDGTVIPYKHPRLNKNAVPSIFHGCQTSAATETNEMPLITNHSPTTEVNLEDPLNLETGVDRDTFESDFNTYLVPIITIDESLFSKIFKSPQMLSLPDQLCATPCNSNDIHQILISEMSVRFGKPFMDKQIIIDNELRMKYFVGFMEIPECIDLPSHVVSLEDIRSAVSKLLSKSSCYGGPSINDYCNDTFFSECWQIDWHTQRWRHNHCHVIVDNDHKDSCSKCKALKYVFNKRQNRPANLSQNPRINSNMKHVITAVDSLRKNYYKANRALKRQQQQNVQLKEKFKSLQQECSDVPKANASDHFKGTGLSTDRLDDDIKPDHAFAEILLPDVTIKEEIV